jgi:hypothetical protein
VAVTNGEGKGKRGGRIRLTRGGCGLRRARGRRVGGGHGRKERASLRGNGGVSEEVALLSFG